jgi:hypothetical protein
MNIVLSLESLVRAMVHTLSVLGVGVEELGAPMRVRGDDERADVSSQLLVSTDARMLLALASDAGTAVRLASTISGEPVAVGSTLCADTLGELLNVAVGVAEPRGARQFGIPVLFDQSGHVLSLVGSHALSTAVKEKYLKKEEPAAETAPAPEQIVASA